MLPASPCKDVLDDTARDLGNGDATLIQRVQHHSDRGTEAPDDPDDDPCGKSAHAKDGTREEERERYQNEHDKSQGN